MNSKRILRIVRTSPVDLAVAYFKNPEYKRINGTFYGSSNYDYLYSPIDETAELLKRLKEEGRIPKYGTSSDMGAGDFRIVALLASLGIASFGVEKDGTLCLIGRENIDNLQRAGAIRGDHLAHVIPGDFTQSRTYDRAGIKFSDFGTIFHHSMRQPTIGLVERVVDESDPGTKLIHVNMESKPRKIFGMKRESSEKIRDGSVSLYTHVYRKRKK